MNFTPEIPVGRRVELFGLVRVKVTVEVPPDAIAVVLNVFVIVGFWITRILALASSGFFDQAIVRRVSLGIVLVYMPVLFN